VFPFGLSGLVLLKLSASSADAVETAVRRIEALLADASATTVNSQGSTVRFTAGVFRAVWNWNILVPFGSGLLEIRHESECLAVHYRLSTAQMFFVVLAMLGLAAFVIWNGNISLQSCSYCLPDGRGYSG
jgi:hypothetical protein